MERARIESWPDRLEAAIAAQCHLFDRVMVLRETDSTQKAASRMEAKAGTIITAWRQASGRGRLGRHWADTGEDGTACTFVVGPDMTPLTEQLAIASAVGVAHAIEALLGQTVDVKWPNDILTGGRKLSGILIERQPELALVGIGINVSQLAWPAELADIAVSLAQLGCRVDRLEVLESLVRFLDRALRMETEEIVDQYLQRDALVGTQSAFRCDNRVVSGLVERLDPLHGLVIRTEAGEEVWLPAASTTMHLDAPTA